MKTRQELKQIAKERLAANRGNCIGVYVLVLVASAILGGISFGLGALVLLPILSVAMAGWFYRVFRGENLTINDWFTGMFDDFGRKWLGMFWAALKVFLWSLLLVIPGIIAAYRYSMAVYIMLDDPSKSPMQCIRESKEMTRGYKGQLFVLDLSFIGWAILSIIPFVAIYTEPYIATTKANFYRALRGEFNVQQQQQQYYGGQWNPYNQ